MAFTKRPDNYTLPENKARWGFSGEPGNITIGEKTAGETMAEGDVLSLQGVDPDPQTATNNGGGDTAETKGLDLNQPENSSDSLTKDQIKAQLDANGIEYSATATKAELLQLLNQE